MKANNVATKNVNILENIDWSLWDVLRLIVRLANENERECLEGKLNCPVFNVMSKDINTIEHTATLHDAVTTMIKKGKGYVVVTRHGVPFGIITEKDVVCAIMGLGSLIKNLKLDMLASRPLIHINPMQTIRKAANLMVSNNIRRMPVVDTGKLVGIMTMNDFTRLFS